MTDLNFDFPINIIPIDNAEYQVRNTLQVFNYTPIYKIENNKKEIVDRKWTQIPTKEIEIYEDLFELKNNYILLTLPEVDEKVIPEIGDTIIIYLIKDVFRETNKYYNTNSNNSSCFVCKQLGNTPIIPIIFIVENIEYTVTGQGKVKEDCILKLTKGYDYFYLDKEKKNFWGFDKNNVPDNLYDLINRFNETLTKTYNYLYINNDETNYKDIKVTRSERFNESQNTSIQEFLEYLEFTKPDNICTYFIYSILGYKWVTLQNLTQYTQDDLDNRIVLTFNDYLADENKITRKYFAKNFQLSTFTKTFKFNGENINDNDNIKVITLNNGNSGYDILQDYLKECFLSDITEVKLNNSNNYMLRVGDKVRFRKKNKIEFTGSDDDYDGYVIIKSISTINTKGYKTKEIVLSRIGLKKLDANSKNEMKNIENANWDAVNNS